MPVVWCCLSSDHGSILVSVSAEKRDVYGFYARYLKGEKMEIVVKIILCIACFATLVVAILAVISFVQYRLFLRKMEKYLNESIDIDKRVLEELSKDEW